MSGTHFGRIDRSSLFGSIIAHLSSFVPVRASLPAESASHRLLRCIKPLIYCMFGRRVAKVKIGEFIEKF